MVRVGLKSRLNSFRGSNNHTLDNGSSSNGDTSLDGMATLSVRSTSPAAKLETSASQPTSGQMMLRVNVIRARNLAAKDKNGSSDPYLVLTLGDAKDTTVRVSKSLNPEWHEKIELPITSVDTLLLEVTCWDKDRWSKEYMGEFDVALEDIFMDGKTTAEPTWYALRSRRSGKKKSVVSGEVLLELSIHDPLLHSITEQQLFQRLMTLVAGSASIEAGNEDADTDGRGDTSDEAGNVVSHSEMPERKRRRRRLAKLRRKATQRAYEFSGSSDLHGVLFLEISRITNLPPERNVTRTSFDMDPFVVASLGKKTYKTKKVRHSLNPVYDEKMLFHVMRHETQYSLSFTVIDRDKLSGNDYVGSCDFSIGQVTALAPEVDPTTGLYRLREPSGHSASTSPPPFETRRSRFRIASSRTSSSNSLARTQSRTKLQKHESTMSLHDAAPADEAAIDSASPPAIHANTDTAPALAAENTIPDDADLATFSLPLILKNEEKWEKKPKSILYIRARYMPYKALRQQFWRAMLRQYDADKTGSLNQVELTTMLDTLGSTLHESTIDSLFAKYNSVEAQDEPSLTIDQAVICLEGLLDASQEHKKSWNHFYHLHHQSFSGSAADHPRAVESSSSSRSQSPETGRLEPLQLAEDQLPHSAVYALKHEHHGAKGEKGGTINTNDLNDGNSEEHVVEIRECPICHQPRLKKKSDADIILHIATCASQDWRQVNNIMMAGFVTSSQARRKWYSKVVTKIGYGGYRLGANSANILVQDRMTGQINEERMSVYVRLGIRLLYKGVKSRDMEKRKVRKLLRSMSIRQGRRYDDPASAAEIVGFINFHRLDMTEVLLPVEQFKTFNQFFYRQLKPSARPCSAPDRPEIVTSPADCRTVCFNRLDEAQSIWVKGREFSIERLLGNAYPEDAPRYKGGALGIYRLAPQDYHRFHIPVDGVMGKPKPIDGEYYTVNPMAIRSALDVYGENVRVIVPIDSVKHGRVMVICVGAMMVGSTIITRRPGETVKRAEELGYFKFGGSTLLLLFEPGVMRFDEDLTTNSTSALETLVRVGVSVGHHPSHAPHSPDMRKKHEEATQEEKQEARQKIEGSIAPGWSKTFFGGSAASMH